jgi:outer membrane autotransporter protein
LSEGFVSSLTLVNQGVDTISGTGMESAVGSAKAGIGGGGSLTSFGAISAGSMRYHTGSFVDISSFSLMTGFSLGRETPYGFLTLAPFLEYGYGSYDTFNSFNNGIEVNGKGHTRHIGGGLLTRLDFVNTGSGHFHAEIAERAGRVNNEYDSDDLRDFSGKRAEYDSSSAYYGLNLGTGYVLDINDKSSLDLYGQYFWTRQEGDSLRLTTGDPVSFKAVDSHRLRLGSRFNYVLSDHFSPYVGLAWEREFNGQARASTNGYAIEAPSLQGDTGIGEIGFNLKPSPFKPLSFDLGLLGYVGKREGVTGNLKIKFEF